MKKLIILSILLVIVLSANSQEQDSIIFFENFDAATKPSGWSQEKVIGLGGTPSGSIQEWQYTNGGYYDYPEYPYQGARNAMFQLESNLGETTKLITPALDLSDVSKPELRFAHVQQIWENEGVDYWDRLKVYYKRGADSAWVLLQAFESPVSNWVDRTILLPDSSKSSTYYIAFEGKTGFGWGTCIDTMRIVETGKEAKYLSSYTINQTSTNFIPTNTLKNPILYINLNVKGNDDTLYLDSLKVTSLNTSDGVIANNGVKLYVTSDSVFLNPTLISTGTNFVNGIASFNNIRYDLPRGNTTVWVTYDIAAATNHDIHNTIADAQIKAYGIYINGYGFPFSDKSPDGSRLIKEALFNDSFESDLGWELNGSFERAIPLGLGNYGNPDPSSAYNGSYIIGTDLTIDGLYSNELPRKQDSAVSPNFNCFYYKDVTLYFARWLNVEYWDKATIDISNDNKNTWTEIFRNNTGAVIEDSWVIKDYDLNAADYKENVSIRFALDTTNDVNQYTGWNIDDFIIIGDFISKDVGITDIILPETGCGHTTSDEISVYIKNYAGEATPTSVPLRYSIDGSTSYVVDAYPSSISIGNTVPFTFSVGANLSAPGSHSIKVETMLPGDEMPSNNSKTKTIFSYPTLTLPYSQNFETNNGYFVAGGVNSTWQYGTPAGVVINSAASGTKAWVTNLTGSYSINDSSYIESPCFNFSGTDSIIFEFKCKGLSEDKTDGLSVMYSLNEGDSWNLLPNDHDYYWNWYNETNISELELPGIDTTSGQWLTFRQLLPSELSNQANVKFKFVFESNENTNYEGFGIDDIKIYETPNDVGITSIEYPYNRCEWSDTTHVIVKIRNYGPSTVKSETVIPIGLKFNSTTINESLTLTSNLAPNATKIYTFTSTVDMSNEGDYDFTAYTKLESNTYFYNQTVSNDTAYATISVLGMPNYNPFQDQIGDHPVDTILDPSPGIDYDNYDWSHVAGTDNARLQNIVAEGKYYVTVTNSEGCTATDSVEVIDSEIDLTMEHIYSELVDSCERNALTEISVRFMNNSFNNLEINDTVPLAYQINNSTIVRDTLFVSSPILVGGTEDFTFAIKADFTNPEPYALKVFIDILKDLNHTDDTIIVDFNTWGYVDVELAYDTIYSSQADTLELVATPGYTDYLWNTTEIKSTISPTDVSQWYKVTVSDDDICGSDMDSTYVETYDFGINNIISPVSACSHSSSTPIQVSIRNYSGNTYSIGTTIPVKYNFNNSGWVNDIVTITSSNFSPLTNRTFTLPTTINPSAVGEHSLEILIHAQQDANTSNDSIIHTFETWGYPSVDLAFDTIFTTKADTITLVATPGLFSYEWNTGSTNDSLVITDKFSRKYYVDVADEHGCGVDSDTTWIITYNLGASALALPKSACEHTTTETVRVTVKNYGQDTLLTGTIIPVGYILNSNTPVHENMTLTSDLLPSGSANYTFTAKANLAGIATYNFKLYTRFGLEVYTANDTLVDVIKTFGYPSIEIGDDIYTTEPETLTLVAPSGYNYYKWNDGTTTNTLDVTYPATKLYSVIVTDINGCSTTDQLTVYTYNVAAETLVAPVSKCELTNAEQIIIGVVNNSRDTLLTGENISVSYRLSTGNLVTENHILANDLLPDETVNHSFATPIDLSVYQNYDFKVFARYTIDVNTNDTASISVEFRRPDLDLGDDINTTEDQVTLDAGAGFTSYLWFDGSTQQTYTVNVNNQTPNFYYSVTVTNALSCSTTDSVLVSFDVTPDLSVTELVSPQSDCLSDSLYYIDVEITNTGGLDIAASRTIVVSYKIDNGTAITEDHVLSVPLFAGNTMVHRFADRIPLASAKTYQFKTYLSYTGDVTQSNDTLDAAVTITSPNFAFSSDTLKTNSYPVVLDPGSWSSYLWHNGSTNRTFSVTSDGWYKVTVTDIGGCEATDSVYLMLNVGIDGTIKGQNFTISYYPNPVRDQLTIEIDAYRPINLEIELLNTQGQKVVAKRIKNAEQIIEKLYVGNYVKGVYYIRFIAGNEMFVRKVVIQ